jgi:hypothetical protein
MRAHFFKKATATAAVMLLITVNASADIKIRRRISSGQGFVENVLYLKGTRQREEMNRTPRGGTTLDVAFLFQCDQKQFIWLDFTNKQYAVHSGGEPAAVVMAFNETQAAPSPAVAAKLAAIKWRGLLTETTTVTDTGERREMFGFTARHLKITTVWQAEPAACDGPIARRETDGWYITLLYGIDCSPDISGSISRGVPLPQSRCLNHYLSHRYRYERKQVGSLQLGFPLQETTTLYGDRGRMEEVRTEVLELSTAPLDDALFEVPGGYTRTKFKTYKRPLLSRLFSLFRRG